MNTDRLSKVEVRTGSITANYSSKSKASKQVKYDRRRKEAAIYRFLPVSPLMSISMLVVLNVSNK